MLNFRDSKDNNFWDMLCICHWNMYGHDNNSPFGKGEKSSSEIEKATTLNIKWGIDYHSGDG